MPRKVQKRKVPFEFVLDHLAAISPWTRPMFGCTAVYVEDKIVLVLRKRESAIRDNGVWICTQAEHHNSLRVSIPNMRSIEVFGPGPTNWQVLPESATDFEESVDWVCSRIIEGDPRIGKVPKQKKSKSIKGQGK